MARWITLAPFILTVNLKVTEMLEFSNDIAS